MTRAWEKRQLSPIEKRLIVRFTIGNTGREFVYRTARSSDDIKAYCRQNAARASSQLSLILPLFPYPFRWLDTKHLLSWVNRVRIIYRIQSGLPLP